MTTHDGPRYSSERATWWALAHYVDGAPYIGGRGEPMYDKLRASYLNEAADLTGDLAEVVRELEPGDAGLVLGQVVAVLQSALPPDLSAQLATVGRAVQHMTDPEPDPGPETQAWTYDGTTGGPIGGAHPVTPATPAVPEAATEAPIVDAVVVDPPTDEATGQRAKVSDFLKATQRDLDERRQPQSVKARRRTRKAAGA